MGTCESGQVGNQAALNSALHVLWDHLSDDTCRSLPMTMALQGTIWRNQKRHLGRRIAHLLGIITECWLGVGARSSFQISSAKSRYPRRFRAPSPPSG